MSEHDALGELERRMYREEAGLGICSDPRREFGRDYRIIALLDALADAEARAEAAEAERDEAWKVAAQRRSEARRYYVAWQVARMRARALRGDS